MLDLIEVAYRVNADQVWGGPSWLQTTRFDIFAKVPAGTRPVALPMMLQRLLTERFALAVHKDKKPTSGYALVPGKELLLQKSDGLGTGGCQFNRLAQNEGARLQYKCHKLTMADFVAAIPNMVQAAQYLDGRPVIDRTGLDGEWDFSLTYSPFNLARSRETSTSLFDAIEKQLGMKLVQSMVDNAVLVVDRVNQVPTENIPGIAKRLDMGPEPTEFEVADLKPSAANSKISALQVQPGGRVVFAGTTLKSLIFQTWHVTDDLLVGAPAWLSEDRYTLVAEIPRTKWPTDMDMVDRLIQSLLTERFRLQTHQENRPIPAYRLVAVKPRLARADPMSRSAFVQHVELPTDASRPTTSALLKVSAQNVSMAQLAERLQSIAPHYIHSRVVDGTGLKGTWDFQFSFSPFGAPDERPNAAAETPSDPSGEITISEALDRNLGLKLQPEKHLAQILVIDHIERTPLAN